VKPLYKPNGSTLGRDAACVDRCKEDFKPMAPKKTGQGESTSTIVGRSEITRSIAQRSGLTQKKATEVLEATLDSIREALQKGQEVRLVNFGSFKVRRSAARQGVNPRNRNEKITVPERDRVRFSPGKELSSAVEKK
jgi:nucleoid DNA-binding protein